MKHANLDDRFALSPHADLKERHGERILVLPERAIRLGGSGGEILVLCESETLGRDIVRVLERRYPESVGIAKEVASFLSEMISLGGVTSSGGVT